MAQPPELQAHARGRRGTQPSPPRNRRLDRFCAAPPAPPSLTPPLPLLLTLPPLPLYSVLYHARTEVFKDVGRKYRHILVDEWQDTNGPQYDVVLQLVDAGRQAQVERAEASRAAEAAQREIADGGGDGAVPEGPPGGAPAAGAAAAAVPSSIFIVGDTDQCIYRFRGADYTNVARFVEDFKDCQTIRLGENYRSTANIVRAASAVIGQVSGRDKQDAVAAKAVQVRRDTSRHTAS